MPIEVGMMYELLFPPQLIPCFSAPNPPPYAMGGPEERAVAE